MKHAIDRRTLLRGVGTAVELPWLEAMTRSTAAAARSAVPEPERVLRHLFIYVPNGMHMPDWKPQGSGRDYVTPPLLQPIADYRSRTTLLGGLTLNGARALGDGGGDHARAVASYLTGSHPKKTDGEDIRNGQSVDQRLAELIGGATRLPSLELGLEPSAPAGTCDSGYSCVYTSNMSWRNDRSPVAKEIDPAAVFDRLFSGGDERESAEARARRERRRRSVLDFVAEDARALERRLGATDRRKLDEYLYAVRNLEQRLAGAEKLTAPEANVSDYPRPAGVPESFEEHLKLLFDLAIVALQTDSTRVVSLMVTNAGSNRGYGEIGIPEGHHDLSHHGNDSAKQEKIAKINGYHVGLLKHLLDGMDQVRIGDRSLLDDSLVQYGSGIADGNRHDHDDLPIALIGGAAGRFPVGWHRRYRDETPLTNLYLSMIRNVGGDDRAFGDSTGTLDELLG
ncbi:MAG TPA: hypothetical protein DCQ98_08380 [Planctomycetaceae bacterium]|nr:hypothetical protein [Planctomycetaceae bacterium]